MHISDLMREAHAIALERGWYDPPKSFGEMILMCHTELSEVVEEYRNKKSISRGDGVFVTWYNHGENPVKPEGVPIELADLIIRVADLCENYNIDLEAAITEKMAYNKTRGYRHGNKSL